MSGSLAPWSCVVLFTLLVPLAGCPDGDSPDAGTGGCVTQSDQSIDIGQTGVGWMPLETGDTLPAWQRPQGGIGTRANLRINGYAASADFESVRVAINAVVPETADDGQLGGACRGAVDAGVQDGGEATDPCDRPGRCDEDNVCRLEIADIIYTTFPLICQPDGSLLAPEVPIRFKTYLRLSDVHDREVSLLMELRTAQGAVEAAEVIVLLQESEFIDPETFDPLGGT